MIPNLRPIRRFLFVIAAILQACLAKSGWADVSITLKNSFIETNKNRATVAANYTVVHTHHAAKPASEDGDIHCAGTAPEVGLACVAEVMNAKSQPSAVHAIVSAEGGGPIDLVGVWRVWPEHAGGGEDFIQGDPVDPIVNTNPPHVFELHPLVKVADGDVLGSFKPIVGYTYKVAATAFAKFESWPCKIVPGHDSTTLITNQIGFNYVAFTIELLEDPSHELEDGSLSVFATVPSSDPEVPLVGKLRCILVKDSPPEKKVRTLHAGSRLRVAGVPRVDLALVSYRASHAKDRPELLDRSLPYEMVIVAVMPTH